MNVTNWLSFFLSFALVLILLGLVLFFLKKLQGKNFIKHGKNNIHLIDTLSIGPRQKIVLIRLKDEEVLLGVTVNQINTLTSYKFDQMETNFQENQFSNIENNNSPLVKKFSEILKKKLKVNKEKN